MRELGLPVHSLGAFPFGPRRVPPAGETMRTATLAGVTVGADDWAVADDDGVLFAAASDRDALVAEALRIQDIEGAQADRMRAGDSLRAQLDFAGYRARQAQDPTLTLRRYLAERGNAIET